MRNYESIRFRPDDFQAYLLSPEVGFTSYHFLGVSDNKSKGTVLHCAVELFFSLSYRSDVNNHFLHAGFQRPIHMYIKGEATRPQSAMSDASPNIERSGRLKSVVVVAGRHARKNYEQKLKVNDIS